MGAGRSSPTEEPELSAFRLPPARATHRLSRHDPSRRLAARPSRLAFHRRWTVSPSTWNRRRSRSPTFGVMRAMPCIVRSRTTKARWRRVLRHRAGRGDHRSRTAYRGGRLGSGGGLAGPRTARLLRVQAGPRPRHDLRPRGRNASAGGPLADDAVSVQILMENGLQRLQG